MVTPDDIVPCYDRAMTGRLFSRPFGWDDVEGLHLLMRAAPSDSKLGANAHIGHFYWGLRATPNDDLMRDMRVWLDGASLAAVAWLDPPNSSDAIVAAGADEDTLDDVIAWLEGAHHAGGSGPFAMMAQHGDTARIGLLRRRGYAPSAEGNVRFRRQLDSAPDALPLPQGFSLRHVANDDDIERRVRVETSAYGGLTTSVDRWRLLARRLPGYRPSLDLLAVASDGTGASACTCWYDEANRRGEFEAVGTAKRFQQLGLGKAVITEGIRRLQQLGATEAILYTSIGNAAAIALYRSCEFEIVGEDYAWCKQL